RPLSCSSVFSAVSLRITALGILSRHQGPHSLRHACATHLVQQGHSLKEVGDHLGHRRASSTRIYAKVDLTALREVASLDLGGVL
ncbi:MAG: tyrosine-type recombinase/integrase, partial [Candidatus Micrarchaeaceae archaeon]